MEPLYLAIKNGIWVDLNLMAVRDEIYKPELILMLNFAPFAFELLVFSVLFYFPQLC